MTRQGPRHARVMPADVALRIRRERHARAVRRVARPIGRAIGTLAALAFVAWDAHPATVVALIGATCVVINMVITWDAPAITGWAIVGALLVAVALLANYYTED